MHIAPVEGVQVDKKFGKVDESHLAAHLGKAFQLQSQTGEQGVVFAAQVHQVYFAGPPFAFEAGRRGGECAGSEAGLGCERDICLPVVGVAVLFHFEGRARLESGREERGGRGYHHLVGDVDGDRLCLGCFVEADAELCFTRGIVGNIEFDAVVLTRLRILDGGRFEGRLDAVLFLQIGLYGYLAGFHIGGTGLLFLKFYIVTLGRMYGGGIVGKVFLEGIGVFDRHLHVGQGAEYLDRRILAIAYGYVGLPQVVGLVEPLLLEVAVVGAHGVGAYGNFFGRVEVGQTVPGAGKTAVGRYQL